MMSPARAVLIGGMLFLISFVFVGLQAGSVKEKLSLPQPVVVQEQAPHPRLERRPLLLERERSNVVVFFATKTGANLVPVTLAMNPTDKAAEIAVEKLLAGPPNPASLRKTLPEGTKIRRLHMEGTIAVLDLTGEIKNIPDRASAELALRSLSLTLSQFPGINEIVLSANGERLSSLGGVDLSKPYPRPEFINLGPRPAVKPRADVFYTDEQAMYLVPLSIAVREGGGKKDLALQAIEALLAGPPNNFRLSATVWPGSKVLGLEIEKDKAVINLSKEVIGYGGGTTAETMLVYSVVHTLTAIQGINRVQMLIDGQRLKYLPEGIDIFNPLVRPDRINFVERP